MDQDEEKIAQTDDADKLSEVVDKLTDEADRLLDVSEKHPNVAEKHSPDVFDIHSPYDVTEKQSPVVHK